MQLLSPRRIGMRGSRRCVRGPCACGAVGESGGGGMSREREGERGRRGLEAWGFRSAAYGKDLLWRAGSGPLRA